MMTKTGPNDASGVVWAISKFSFFILFHIVLLILTITFSFSKLRTTNNADTLHLHGWTGDRGLQTATAGKDEGLRPVRFFCMYFFYYSNDYLNVDYASTPAAPQSTLPVMSPKPTNSCHHWHHLNTSSHLDVSQWPPRCVTGRLAAKT